MNEGPRINILHVMILIVLIALIAFVFIPIGPGSHYAPRSHCLSNLKQTGTSMQIYIADFDDRFPLETWQDDIYPYTKNRDLYSCPELWHEKKAKWGYAMNYQILGKVMKTPEDKIVVLFETDALAPNVVANVGSRSTSRHKDKHDGIGGSMVSFGDTRTKFFKDGTSLP